MNKFQDFKLVYRQGGRRLERVFTDTLYANVKRVSLTRFLRLFFGAFSQRKTRNLKARLWP